MNPINLVILSQGLREPKVIVKMIQFDFKDFEFRDWVYFIAIIILLIILILSFLKK